MKYYSTRDTNKKMYDSAQVIKQGLAADGGLFIPEAIPSLTKDDILSLCAMSYPQRAAKILSMFLSDYTYEELLEMRVRNDKTGAEDVILRFEDFLRYFGWRDLTFAIEIKLPGYEAEVLEMMDRFDVKEKSVITSFKFECIERVKALRPDYRVGWLMKDYSEEGNERLRSIGGEQMCPQAKYLTKEKVAAWRAAGFGVRAWGITNEDVMKHACECGVDGMTVNFPDLLTKHLGW